MRASAESQAHTLLVRRRTTPAPVSAMPIPNGTAHVNHHVADGLNSIMRSPLAQEVLVGAALGAEQDVQVEAGGHEQLPAHHPEGQGLRLGI